MTLLVIMAFQQGMWIRASSMARPGSVDSAVQLAEQLDITDIYYQCVVGGYAYYRSRVLPRSQYLARVSPGDYDPLSEMVEKAHRKGIRVHAWVNAMLVWSFTKPPDSANHLLFTHPEWFVRDVSGRSTGCYQSWQWKNMGIDGAFLDPALKEVQDYLARVCSEIAARYPVDGIHLDFFRYPGSHWGVEDQDPEVSALFSGPDMHDIRWLHLARYTRLDFYHRWLVWHHWRASMRRRQGLVDALALSSRAARDSAMREGLVFTCAVVANPGAAGYRNAQTWWRWEDLDYPVMMSYTKNPELFNKYLHFGMNTGKNPVFGIGFLWSNMEQEASSQRQRARACGARGICYFDYSKLSQDVDLEILTRETRVSCPETKIETLAKRFKEPAPASLVRSGKPLVIQGEDRQFARFLLELSYDPAQEIDTSWFFKEVSRDVAGFKAADAAIFPLGQTLIQPPAKTIQLSVFEDISEDSALSLVKQSGFQKDTIIFQGALDPLASEVFKTKDRKTHTLQLGSRILVFKIKKKIEPGRKTHLDSLSPDLVQVFRAYTAKRKFFSLLR